MMIAVPVNQGTPAFERRGADGAGLSPSTRCTRSDGLRVQTGRLEQIGRVLVDEIRFAGLLALRLRDGLLDRRGPRLVRRHFSGELGQEVEDDTHQTTSHGEAGDAPRLLEAVRRRVVHGRREGALPENIASRRRLRGATPSRNCSTARHRRARPGRWARTVTTKLVSSVWARGLSQVPPLPARTEINDRLQRLKPIRTPRFMVFQM